jgi:hypothetical protein
MDYKIKFEYKGIGKQASATRQRVIQSQKQMGSKIGGRQSQTHDNRQQLSYMKNLNTSIQQLIKSNQQLTKALSGSTGGMLGGGRRGGGTSGGGGSAGIGRVGASLPVIGAAFALTGFAIQKISQIGNAYIDLASQQKGTVGLAGGMRTGRGMYLSGEMGAGMKSYAQKTGRFQKPQYEKKWYKDKKSGKWKSYQDFKYSQSQQSALDIGAIYGLSAQETMGYAGTFERAGANMQNVSGYAMGSGIQSELPTLLSGMAGVMEDAIKSGVDASEMSKTMGKNLVELTKATTTNNADAALNIMKSFQGTKKDVGAGKFGSIQGLYAADASRKMLMEKLTGEKRGNYINKLEKEGYISSQQKKKLFGLKKGASFSDVQKTIGTGAAFVLEKRQARRADTSEMQKRVINNLKKQYGSTPEGMQMAMNILSATGAIEAFGGEQGFHALWTTKSSSGKETDKITKKGAKGIKTKAKEVETSGPGIGVGMKQRKEGMTFKYGKDFALTLNNLDQAMINVINSVGGASGVSSKLLTMSSTVNKASKSFGELIKKVDKLVESADKLFSIKGVKETVSSGAKYVKNKAKDVVNYLTGDK